ncbi:hypothetical protein XPA_001896 [Xanthoria parietina]
MNNNAGPHAAHLAQAPPHRSKLSSFIGAYRNAADCTQALIVLSALVDTSSVGLEGRNERSEDWMLPYCQNRYDLLFSMNPHAHVSLLLAVYQHRLLLLEADSGYLIRCY